MPERVQVKCDGAVADSRVEIRAVVSSEHPQRVTIKPEGLLLYLYQWYGAGECGRTIGCATDQADNTYTVTVESSDDGGKTFKPSVLRLDTISTATRPSYTVITVRSENEGDKDFDDAVVYFSYLAQ
ncbi:hypothetical protein [Streptomyces virginiae]|uniref:hypothetical protein n=1 Tax=Streptomyces virginiae TaxID=1961 RepID=UPI0036B0F546